MSHVRVGCRILCVRKRMNEQMTTAVMGKVVAKRTAGDAEG